MQTTHYYHPDSSGKVYRINIELHGMRYAVNFADGCRGIITLQTGT